MCKTCVGRYLFSAIIIEIVGGKLFGTFCVASNDFAFTKLISSTLAAPLTLPSFSLGPFHPPHHHLRKPLSLHRFMLDFTNYFFTYFSLLYRNWKWVSRFAEMRIMNSLVPNEAHFVVGNETFAEEGRNLNGPNVTPTMYFGVFFLSLSHSTSSFLFLLLRPISA